MRPEKNNPNAESAGESGCGFLLLQSICTPACLFNFYFLFRDSDETADKALKSLKR